MVLQYLPPVSKLKPFKTSCIPELVGKIYTNFLTNARGIYQPNLLVFIKVFGIFDFNMSRYPATPELVQDVTALATQHFSEKKVS